MKPTAKVITANALSPSLTMIHSLQRLAYQFPQRDSFVLHFVGATLLEMLAVSRATEEFLHWLPPHITSLYAVFIGPQVGGDQLFQVDTCPKCTASGRKRFSQQCKILWHELRPSDPQPDAILVLNSGCHDTRLYPTWEPSLKKMLATGVPMILTSYTSAEATLDACILQRYGAHVNWCEQNPFASPIESDDNSFISPLPFCENHSYMSVQKGL